MKELETDSAIVRRYMSEHPSAMEGVERATYAYHRTHREPGGHWFLTALKDCPCRWCGQTREGVRWDWYGQPPMCSKREMWADEAVENVILREELLFERVLERAKKLAAGIDVSSLTGETLATLHHTHGVDPSMLETALGRTIPEKIHDEYLQAYETHRTTGQRGFKPVTITAKSIP